MPCRDSAEHSSPTAPVTAVATNENSIPDECSEEFCPPFCICACCAVARDFITISTVQIVAIEQVSAYLDYQMPAIPEQSAAIYQPPKVA